MFREEPNSLIEMLQWGMIGYRQFERNHHIPWPEVYDYIAKHEGFQTWSFGLDHIAEYVAKNDIDVSSFTPYDWTVHCLKLAKGRMNPNHPREFYNRFVQPKSTIDNFVNTHTERLVATENRIAKAILSVLGSIRHITRKVYLNKIEYALGSGETETVIARIEHIKEGSFHNKDLKFFDRITMAKEIHEAYIELEKMEP